ncbi:MAG: LLM class oxidoreductase [Planctomycetota bacterium]
MTPQLTDKQASKDEFSAAPFQNLNHGYRNTFQAGKLSIGLVVPIENYDTGPVPTMHRHVERIQLAEQLDFSAVWIRDVPFNVPSFGDAGQTYDPFVYLGLLAAKTQTIALGVASVILPLRHPAHVAKAAATADQLSDGRLILGVASGDRPDEYPALNLSYEDRGARFRESIDYIRQMGDDWPAFDSFFGTRTVALDMLPKPTAGKLPLLITGGSQQDADWLARHGDGWMLYPRPANVQESVIREWRSNLQSLKRSNQPILEPLYVDLTKKASSAPTPIHLGYRLGTNALIDYLRTRESIGVNHVAINLRFNQADAEETMLRIAEEVLPNFANGTRSE